MPRLLYDSRTFFAAHSWYGAGSRPGAAAVAVVLGGAFGSRPVPPTPRPEFASSQLPRRVLPPCQTPVKSGLPSAALGTALRAVVLFGAAFFAVPRFAGGGEAPPPPCVDTTAGSE